MRKRWNDLNSLIFDFTTIVNDDVNQIYRPTDRDHLIVTVKGIEMDAKDISFANNVTGRNVAFTVPEPTTATLSLLALAGLAARRRK